MNLSTNSATGQSTNFSCPLSCPYCYCRKRTKADLKLLPPFFQGKIGTNTGPVTWPVQQARYDANLQELWQAYHSDTIPEMAASIARQVRVAVLRQLGNGSLNEAMVELIVECCKLGVLQYLYDRQPHMVELLAKALDLAGIKGRARPYIMGSFDATTSRKVVEALARATAKVNPDGKPALAYVSFGELPPSDLPVVVILGYHDNSTKTYVKHKLTCPKTNGVKGMTCLKCKRCWGHYRRRR